MEQAYNKASSDGEYYANARQIFYAARPMSERIPQDFDEFTEWLGMGRAEATPPASAGELFVVAMMPGEVEREKKIQRQFSHLHYRGEWFNYTGEIAEFIEKNARTLPARGDGFVMRTATEAL